METLRSRCRKARIVARSKSAHKNGHSPTRVAQVLSLKHVFGSEVEVCQSSASLRIASDRFWGLCSRRDAWSSHDLRLAVHLRRQSTVLKYECK